MNPPVAIRTFRHPQDYAAVLALWQSMEFGVHVGRSDAPEEIEKKLTRDPDLFLVAEADGKLIGAVLGGFDGRRGLIYHLAVAKEYRRRGVGAQLMDEVEKRLREKGCLKSYLLVFNGNDSAARFYKDLGWSEMEQLRLFGKELA